MRTLTSVLIYIQDSFLKLITLQFRTLLAFERDASDWSVSRSGRLNWAKVFRTLGTWDFSRSGHEHTRENV